MALYEYSLHLFRPASPGELRDTLARFFEAHPVECPVYASAIVDDEDYPVNNLREWRHTSIDFDDTYFARELDRNGQAVIEALWRLFIRAQIGFAFVPGGCDSPYVEGDTIAEEATSRDLDQLVQHGRVLYPHPLMFFGADLCSGGPARAAAASRWPVKVHDVEHGSLVVFGGFRAASLEIYEPGSHYAALREEVRAW